MLKVVPASFCESQSAAVPRKVADAVSWDALWSGPFQSAALPRRVADPDRQRTGDAMRFQSAAVPRRVADLTK